MILKNITHGRYFLILFLNKQKNHEIYDIYMYIIYSCFFKPEIKTVLLCRKGYTAATQHNPFQI